MKRKLILGILIATAALGLGVNAFINVTREAALARDSVWRFRIGGYDPLDPVRGRYVEFTVPALTRPEREADKDFIKELKPGEAFYATLERGPDGYGRIGSLSLWKPDREGTWLAMRFGDEWIQPPFTRYYVNEDKADALDAEVRKNRDKAYIEVKISNGVGVITRLGFEE